jgi:polyprenyl-phospho-N-acetylgalactosaminyl synthase
LLLGPLEAASTERVPPRLGQICLDGPLQLLSYTSELNSLHAVVGIGLVAGTLWGKPVPSKQSKKLDTRSICTVIAAFNEAGVVGPIVSDLVRRGYSVVVVDDGSQDTTGQVALSAGATVITHPVNLGQGAALQTGLKFALQQNASYIVTFDADGQHRPSDVTRLIDALVEHKAAYALGSRFLGSSSGMPFGRRVLLQAAIWLTRAMTGLRLTDTHNGLRAMTRAGASRISLRQNRMAHASELLEQIAASGLPHVEVPVTIDYTRYSLAKGQRLSDSLTILFDLSAQKLQR